MKRIESDPIVQARQEFATHQVKERVSRSFDFRRPDGSCFFAYSLTWTPGSLALAGDIGELTLVHYQALATLEPGLAWATNSDHHYLLGKSSAKRVFDLDGTIHHLVEDSKGEHGAKVREALRRALRLDDGLRGAALYGKIRRELACEFEEFGSERAGQWIWDLGVYDDWFGQDHYDRHTIFQIEAIRHGAQLALDLIAGERSAVA
jgi:hypothetical protein